MPLFKREQGDKNNPCLVFLHGFLGSTQDWQTTISHLSKQFYCISIDLPGHGHSVATSIDPEQGFERTHHLIQSALSDINQYVLVGYSLGGRIALDYARRQQDSRLAGLVLESCHYGLSNEQSKQQRAQQDQKWAKRFATQSVIDTLYQWYEQLIFDDLSALQKSELIHQRSENYGVCLANMLLATSLSKQTCALPFLQASTLPIHYLYGEKDNKFKQLAQDFQQTNHVTVTPFTGVGHNIHHQSPLDYAQYLIQHFA